MNVSLQMIGVAIGWQVYAAHRSTLALGLIGLAEFVPLFVLALPAGHLADRLPRRVIYGGSLLMGAAVAGGLAALSAAHVTAEPAYLGMAVGVGVTMALESPASGAMPPTLIPPPLLADAMSLSSVATTSASVLGPALGGLLFAISAPLVYLVACGACVGGAVCALARRPSAPIPAQRRSDDLHSVLEGLRFVRRTPVLLGAILLDLLGVLFGGVVGLLPVFARSYLHVGPFGLGVLRAAPAIGALLGAAVITRRSLDRDTGRALLGGGALTIMIAIGWRWAFPALARADRLQDLAPEPETA